MEYAHHGDALVPRQQRFGTYTRSLLHGLGLPVENRYGLRPALIGGTKKISRRSPSIAISIRPAGSTGVTTFNFHMHLPHYALTADTDAVRVLAKQPIDLSRPHPFTEAGNREFNTCLWAAARRRPRRRHPDGRFDGVQHAVRRATKALSGSGGISRSQNERSARRSHLAVRWLPLRSRGRRLAATPIHGHYPPGPDRTCAAARRLRSGWSLTDFNRLFSNLEIKDQSGATVGQSRRTALCQHRGRERGPPTTSYSA